MSLIRRTLPCALALSVLALALALPAAPLDAASRASHPTVGIGDDNTAMFSDPRFLALNIKSVRYDMHWDALSVGWSRKALTNWMNDARAHHLDVLVTIDHSDRYIYKKVKVREKIHGRWVEVRKRKGYSQTRVLPSVSAYSAAFKAFHKRFPWVKNFVTWDETNFRGEATYDKESLVAQYYRALRSDCRSCTILAAEFLDVNRHSAVPMATWARAFVKALGYQPGYWGLNNYEDANHLVTTSTRQLLKAVTGKIWFAETGGIVARQAHPHADFAQNPAHAAKVDQFVLEKLAALSPRIQRVYLYEWRAKTKHDSWDSALVSYTNAPREGYVVVAKVLSAWGIRPDCSISRVPPTCTGLGGGGSGGSTGPTGSTGATGATGPTGATG